MQAVLAGHLAATAFMTGLIWFVQVVHYPLFAEVGAADFVRYERDHMRRTTWVVGPVMLAEAALATVIALWTPSAAGWIGFGLLAAIWISTAALQVPCHQRLCGGFDGAVSRRLVATNWIRTAAWTCRCALAVGMMM